MSKKQEYQSKLNNNIDKNIESKLIYTTFLQREKVHYHHSYDEELLQYEYVRDGDIRSIEESKRLFRTGIAGKLSEDPIFDKKYLFVASTTLATRFCIEGGMDEQEAYNMSDLFIQGLDKCFTVQDIYELQTNMITTFTEKMAAIHYSYQVSEQTCDSDSFNIKYSKPIRECMDYIYYHLHYKLTLQELANQVSLSPNYLAILFKKEKGITIQEYIRSKRIEAAKNMLLYSDYTQTEIGQFLAFSSSSHFIKVFKDQVGLTPKQYHKKYYRKHAKWANKFQL
ncbi:helix-turn-helix domain-containing protein [Clostridium sp. SHJSY1]|uniref:helix-turn-helix domain-containing protein n=1 Tax=Clostridium sp. SHJSY1 TaxID=2942483 RepID=UPI00287534AA|nr:helix-turn-helix domain-containing protein [Clostridium sp. SHJSY1]MDS0526241.1 helix-turn-helix domain-containing protein [Clostridium sp. SHJSY1]